MLPGGVVGGAEVGSGRSGLIIDVLGESAEVLVIQLGDLR